LSSHPPLLTLPDSNKSTPLHHASAQESPTSLLALLSAVNSKDGMATVQLDLNCTNMYGRTPLHCAVAYNSLYNVDLLLMKGANPQLTDNEGKSPLDYAKELENESDMIAILESEYLILIAIVHVRVV